MFSDGFDSASLLDGVEKSLKTTENDLDNLLKKSQFSLDDLPQLLSPKAAQFLPQLSLKSQLLTQQRFGQEIQLFAPIYVSNLCSNICTYCGFSANKKYQRKVLNEAEIHQEAQFLAKKGFQHILLLTGEAEKKVGVDYLKKAVGIMTQHFSSVAIEVQPLETADYHVLFEAGVDGLTVFQETYHPESYKKFHKLGKKMDFSYRLDTLDRGGAVGFHHMTLGALLGLYHFRFEALALAQHLHYLKKRYWRTKYSVSFPRIQEMGMDFSSPYPIGDDELKALICAFRLVFPDLGIVLSTREPANLRDELVNLGVTTMSAGSCTAPGGYSVEKNTAQFEISDNRGLPEIMEMLKNQKKEPKLKDWDRCLV